MSEAVALRGFFMLLRCPTEEGLNWTIDASDLSPTTFIQVIHRLQDLLRDIDEAFTEHPERLRGRSLRARHFRAFQVDERRRILRFAPFPSKYINKMKTIRRRLYELVHQHSIVIQSGVMGPRNIYLLPQEEAESFLNEVELLNAQLQDLQREVEGFLKTRVFDDILYELERVGLPTLETHFYVGRIRAYLLPVSLDPHALEVWARYSPRVADAVREAQEEFVSQALEDLRGKLKPLIEGLRKARRLERIAENLYRLERLAQDLGLRSVAETVIVPLRRMAEMEPDELKRIPGGLDARIDSLLGRL